MAQKVSNLMQIDDTFNPNKFIDFIPRTHVNQNDSKYCGAIDEFNSHTK